MSAATGLGFTDRHLTDAEVSETAGRFLGGYTYDLVGS